MNYNTFLIRYGIDPKCFKNKELFPIKTDTGYLYYLEQETEIVRKCPKCNRTDLHIKAYYSKQYGKFHRKFHVMVLSLFAY